MLEVLAGRRVLMLQGPAGPFFRRVARQLEGMGATVTKVNFNAADDLFFKGRNVEHFRGRFDEFPVFVGTLLDRDRIEAIVLFGDTRPLHRMAIAEADARGIDVYVFEEGYLRPDFVTFEKDGVSGHSRIPRNPEFYRAVEPGREVPPRPVGNALAWATGWTIVYACTNGMFRKRYPHYRHHRDIRPFHQAYYWVRGAYRRMKHVERDRGLDERIEAGALTPFFFVPLQVHLDAAVGKHSAFDDIESFVAQVVASFARHAPSDTKLILKDHPLGRPYRDYTQLIERLRREHALGDRLVYVDLIHLPTTLKEARGTVTINSTVGLSSIHHDTPVICLGRAIYDMPGLTFQGDLDAFWNAPGDVDRDLYRRFRWWLLQNNQINGSVWKELWP
ncbi:MAG: capsular biosynthesis protein [Polyangiaceae bacterium]